VRDGTLVQARFCRDGRLLRVNAEGRVGVNKKQSRNGMVEDEESERQRKWWAGGLFEGFGMQ